MLKKLFQNSVQFFQWYLGVWWRALIPLLFLGMVCIVCECLWSFLPSHRICDWISKLAFLLFLFFLLVNLVAGIFHFRRNYWKRGVAVWLLSLFVSLVVFVVLVGFMFLLGFMDVDHFADSLKLPEGITLSEPLPNGYPTFPRADAMRYMYLIRLSPKASPMHNILYSTKEELHASLSTNG